MTVPLRAMEATTLIPDIKFLGKPLPDAETANIISVKIQQSLDAVTEMTIDYLDPNFEMLKRGYFQSRMPVDYKDYQLVVTGIDAVQMGGREGITIHCRPALVQKLKQRVGALVYDNISPAEFVVREVKACGGLAVVQPLAARAQVSRDVPVQGEDYDSDNTPSSWTTFRRLADENGYVLFEQSGVVYFGKPSWLIKSFPVGGLDIWWFDPAKQNTLTMPKCSRSIDSPEVTVNVTMPKNYAQHARVGQRLTLKDMPTFSGDYVVNSVSYSALGIDGEVSISAKTMKDEKPRGVSEDMLNKWMGGKSGFDWASLLNLAGGGSTSGPGVSWGTGIASSLSPTQLSTASTIIQTTYSMGFSDKAAIIALATAMQESTLGANPSTRKPNGDGDAGVFQQRIYKGWYGTLAEVNNVAYGAKIFLVGKKLTAADVAGASNPAGPVGYTIPGLKQIKGWENMSVTQAAQAVQRSAFPNAYAKHESLARALVQQYNSTKTTLANNNIGSGSFYNFVKGNVVTTPFGRKGSMWSLGYHTGVDFSASTGDPCYAITDGRIVSSNWGSAFGTHVILEIAGGVRIAYCHLRSATVASGQSVKRGQVLGYCDSTGNVSGPHLHVECRNPPYRFPNDCIDVMKYIEWGSQDNRTSSPSSKSNSRSVRDFVNLCLAQTGKPYVYAAEASINNASPTAFDCIREGSLVHTPQGPVPIEELRVGDLVHSRDADGNPTVRPVRTTFAPVNHEIWKIRTGNRTLESSADHPVRVVSKLPRERDNKGRFLPVQWTEAWVKASEVVRGDLIVTSNGFEGGSLKNAYGMVMDEDLAWLVGQFVGDGSHRQGGINICAFDPADRTRLLDIVGRKFGVEGVLHPSHGVYWTNMDMSRWFKQATGPSVRSWEKTVPSWVPQLPEPVLRAFLDGYQSADGSEDDRANANNYHSSSLRLLKEVRALHIQLGDRVSNITTNLRKRPIAINGVLVKDAKPLHTFGVYMRELERNRLLMDAYNLRDHIGKFSVERVLSSETTGAVDRTYDIEVAEDHCFFVEGVLAKNCSELIEWAVGRVGGSIPDGVSGQYSYCKSKGTLLGVSKATEVYGALLFRLGGGGANDHVEVSLGNGKTIGAVGRSYGVRQMSASGRGWTHGGYVPNLIGYQLNNRTG